MIKKKIGICIGIIIYSIIIFIGICLYKKNFIDENILNILGVILGNVLTIVVLFVTVKQTRKIQNENMNINKEIIKLQKNIELKSQRTYVTHSSIGTDLLFKKYNNMFCGEKIIVNNEYIKLKNILRKGTEYNKLLRKITSEELTKRIDDIREFNKFNFSLINNIGKNHMYNCKIIFYGRWELLKNDTVEIQLDCIEAGEKIFLPMFKYSDELKYSYFSIEKITIIYYTGIADLKEKVTHELIYKDNLIEQKLEIDEVNEEVIYDTVTNYGFDLIK